MLKVSLKVIGGAVLLFGVLGQAACATASNPSGNNAVLASSGGDVDPMATGLGSGVSSNPFARMMGDNSAGKSREQVAAIARRANARPLGTPENPVRANQPQGQRAYIARLRCANGATPEIKNRYNIGVGIYGNIVDNYLLGCRGSADQTLSLDMYHDWVENRAAAGFTIAPLPGQPVT